MATAHIFANRTGFSSGCSTQKPGWAARRCPRWRGEEGAITAEFAVALPAVILVVAFVLILTNIALSAATLQSAARSGARVAVVESSAQVIHTHVAQLAGPGTTIEINLDQAWATVSVRKDVMVGPFQLGMFQLHSSATSLREEEVGQW